MLLCRSKEKSEGETNISIYRSASGYSQGRQNTTTDFKFHTDSNQSLINSNQSGLVAQRNFFSFTAWKKSWDGNLGTSLKFRNPISVSQSGSGWAGFPDFLLHFAFWRLSVGRRVDLYFSSQCFSSWSWCTSFCHPVGFSYCFWMKNV